MPRHVQHELPPVDFEIPQLVPDEEPVEEVVVHIPEIEPQEVIHPAKQALARRALHNGQPRFVQAMPTYVPGRRFYGQ